MLFEDIEVLLVLSKAKSLSQAAGQLYMSRPGLSQKNCRHRETARHVAHQPDLHRHFSHASGQGGREIRSEYG